MSDQPPPAGETAAALPPLPPTAMPDAPPLPYHQALRNGRRGWWWGALSIVSLVVAFFIVSFVLTALAIGFDLVVGNTTIEEVAAARIRFTPALMLMNNLSLAALIPVAMLLQWGLHGVRPGRISSVLGRFRWRWFWRSAAIIVPIWIVYVGVSFALEPVGAVGLTTQSIALVVIVLVTTPLQAAGEEYGARGLLNRAAGAWSADPRIAFVLGALVSSVLFSLAHLAGDPWLIAYYFVFGVALCAVVTGTGGLEGAVVLHAVNNVLLLVPTVLAGQLDQVFERGEGAGGPYMLLPMAICAGAAALIVWWGRRSGTAVLDAGATD